MDFTEYSITRDSSFHSVPASRGWIGIPDQVDHKLSLFPPFFFLHFRHLIINKFHLASFVLLLMAGRSDGSTIKALFSPNKGDFIPPRKKNISLSIENVPPPDQNVESPNKNTNSLPLTWQKRKKSIQMKQKAKLILKMYGKHHLKFRWMLTTYSSGQGPSPAERRSMVLCSIWRK